jgi:segregation and condensation protein B
VPLELLTQQIEAVLFASPSPVTPIALARTLCVEVREVRDALESLRESCRLRGVEPIEVAGGIQFRTKAEHGDLLRRFLQAKPSRLSRAALETLAIVAYRQPITRVEVEDVRGVDSGAVLRGLMERRLVRIIGRKEEPGRPILYGTTPTFLELFGIKSLKELPTLREFVELSEEHQRVVDRDAPVKVEATAQEMADYLADLEAAGEAAAAELDVELEKDDEAADGDEASPGPAETALEAEPPDQPEDDETFRDEESLDDSDDFLDDDLDKS